MIHVQMDIRKFLGALLWASLAIATVALVAAMATGCSQEGQEGAPCQTASSVGPRATAATISPPASTIGSFFLSDQSLEDLRLKHLHDK